MKASCETCDAFLAAKIDDRGWCRAKSPTVLYDTVEIRAISQQIAPGIPQPSIPAFTVTAISEKSVFPPMHKDGWCRDYRKLTVRAL